MREKKNRIVFLGYNNKETSLINFLKKKNFRVVSYKQKKPSKISLNNDDIIISFGYRHIIKKNKLKKLKKTPINLHMSYLPYNRGSHPNFWSFINNTPKGITIHEIDEGIDTGKIILQKKILFKKGKKITFKNSYNLLFIELEKLFKKNYLYILSGNYKTKKNKKVGKIHLKKDLKKKVNWNLPIQEYIKKYH